MRLSFINSKIFIWSILIIVLLTIVGFYLLPINLSFIKISEKTMSQEVYKAWWRVVDSKKAENYFLENYGVSFPEIDFKENNLLISVGCELKTLKYTHISKYFLPYRTRPYIAEATFRDKMTPQVIYFYKIKLRLFQENL